MKIAFPFQKDMVANHFCKAGDFCCWDLDDNQNHIAFTNPSANDDCAGHQLIVERLVDFGVSTVLVRQIGQRMLSRLLDKSISVWQLKGPLAAQDLAQYQQHWEQVATALTEASQGRESVKFAQKHSCSDGCGAKQTCAENEHHHGCGHCHCSHHHH